MHIYLCSHIFAYESCIIAVFVLVTLHRNYDICIRIDHVEAQKTSDEIRMDDILKIEEFEEN